MHPRLDFIKFSWFVILICGLVGAKPGLVFAYEVKGKIRLDDNWERTIYLSVIPSFDDRNTASEDLIINVAPIYDDGSFTFIGENLPEGDRLYRLHVCKIGDPLATIFIGGKEENHVHFVMNNNSNIIFQNEDMLFQNCLFKGHPANTLLRELNTTVESWQSPDGINSKTNWEYNQRQLDSYLHHFADTCSNGLVAMLAVHQLNIQRDYLAHPDFYKKLMKKWQESYGESPYYAELAQQIAFIRYKQSPTVLNIALAVAMVLLIVFTGIYLLQKQRRKGVSKEAESLRNLSVQEQKVFDMLVEGKANKEISSELNIEVSTVKSHVSSIYIKLGVKSRKEIYKWKEGDS